MTVKTHEHYGVEVAHVVSKRLRKYLRVNLHLGKTIFKGRLKLEFFCIYLEEKHILASKTKSHENWSATPFGPSGLCIVGTSYFRLGPIIGRQMR